MEHPQPTQEAQQPQQRDISAHNLSTSAHTPQLPNSVYLMEDWCTPAEEGYLIGRVNTEGGGRWTQLSGRRLQNWGGAVYEKGMIPQKSESRW